jgi:hypothetical protein
MVLSTLTARKSDAGNTYKKWAMWNSMGHRTSLSFTIKAPACLAHHKMPNETPRMDVLTELYIIIRLLKCESPDFPCGRNRAHNVSTRYRDVPPYCSCGTINRLDLIALALPLRWAWEK